MDLSPLSQIIPSFGSPTLEGFDTSNIQDGQRLGGSPNRQAVRFYKKKIVELRADKVRINPKTGNTEILSTKPVEVEKEFVSIVTPGDKNSVDDFAQDYHKREYFRQYAAFRAGKTAPIGLDIEECSFISAPVATELRYRGILVVEQLAEASDEICNILPDGYNLREFARAMVKATIENKSLGHVNVLKIELENTKKQMQEMQAQMTALLAAKEKPATKKE